MLILSLKIDDLTKIVEEQRTTINYLKDNVDYKLNLLLKNQGIEFSEQDDKSSKNTSSKQKPSTLSEAVVRLPPQSSTENKQKSKRPKRSRRKLKSAFSLNEKNKEPEQRRVSFKVEHNRIDSSGK